jgi:predicted metal-dependent phosphoesterase TrpH
MNSFRADLHCHSVFSDGSETPEGLLKIATEKGLSALSITDHDTAAAYETAMPLFSAAGIDLLTGVEFSTTYNETNIHILGYGFDPKGNAVQQLCLRHTRRREARNQAMLALLAKQGIDIQPEDLLNAIPQESITQKRVIGRPHIAIAMIKKGYVSTPHEAFQKYLAEGRPCYIQGERFTIEETLDAIHADGGIASIAHPHLIKNGSIVSYLLTKPFDAIECYYGNFQAHHHTRWLKIARHKGWLITGGSDFHGTAKPGLELGSSWIGKEDYDALRNRLSQMR